VDLRDLWRPGGGTSRLTYRQVGSWIARLPGESQYKTAVRESLSDEQLAELSKRPREGHGPWSQSELLLAHIGDVIRVQTYILQAINTDKAHRSKLRAPEPYPRPGVAAKKAQQERKHVEHGLSAQQRALLESIHTHALDQPPEGVQRGGCGGHGA
jgi:hypothetical protein